MSAIGSAAWSSGPEARTAVLLLTDDPVHEVNAEFLGPKGWTTPWRARYVAYCLGFGVLLLILAVERRIGLGIGAMTCLYDLAATVFITRSLGRLIDHERPARTLAVTFWHELTAPRTRTQGSTAVLRPGQVKVRRPRSRSEGRSRMLRFPRRPAA